MCIDCNYILINKKNSEKVRTQHIAQQPESISLEVSLFSKF